MGYGHLALHGPSTGVSSSWVSRWRLKGFPEEIRSRPLCLVPLHAVTTRVNHIVTPPHGTLLLRARNMPFRPVGYSLHAPPHRECGNFLLSPVTSSTPTSFIYTPPWLSLPPFSLPGLSTPIPSHTVSSPPPSPEAEAILVPAAFILPSLP